MTVDEDAMHDATCNDACMNEHATMQDAPVEYHHVPLKEWAEHHGVSIRTVHNYLAAGKLDSSTKLGNSWMIALEEAPPTGKGGGKPASADTFVAHESPATRPAPAGGGLVPVAPHSLIHGTEPVDRQTLREELDDQPLWIEPEIAARFIGVSTNALYDDEELRAEYGGRIIGRRLLFPQRIIRKEYAD